LQKEEPKKTDAKSGKAKAKPKDLKKTHKGNPEDDRE
jgi:hypothetical protein